MQAKRHTGGISLGKSTLLVITILPFSRGHLRSTLPICSQRSALVLRSLMSPYLTVNITYAPSSMVSLMMPLASMTSSLPLLRG